MTSAHLKYVCDKGTTEYLEEVLIADVSLKLRVHLTSNGNSGDVLVRILQPLDLTWRVSFDLAAPGVFSVNTARPGP